MMSNKIFPISSRLRLGTTAALTGLALLAGCATTPAPLVAQNLSAREAPADQADLVPADVIARANPISQNALEGATQDRFWSSSITPTAAEDGGIQYARTAEIVDDPTYNRRALARLRNGDDDRRSQRLVYNPITGRLEAVRGNPFAPAGSRRNPRLNPYAAPTGLTPAPRIDTAPSPSVAPTPTPRRAPAPVRRNRGDNASDSRR
ncbi:MAG: hypothetical protein AAF610_15180 [Pseudomonadota bacterium]